MRFIKKYDEAVNNNDAAALAALYTEDALFVADTGPLYGRQAIDNFYADAFKVLHPKNYISKEDPNSARFVGTPDNVASNGEWSFTGQGETGGLLKSKAIGRRLILMMALLGRSGR